MPTKRLSIVILTYNSERDIYACLDSIYQYNDIGEDLEVIIVDNQSAQFQTMQGHLAEKYPQVRVMQHTHNGGYGQGNNAGIRLAQAPIVAVMNPDVRLIHPILSDIVRCFDAHDVLMCGCKQMQNIDKPGWSFAYDFTTFGCVQVLLRHIMQKYDLYDEKRMWLSGAFFAIKKDVFEKIGLFDEQIFMYGEECDIHRRICHWFPTGHIKYIPSLRYLHLSYDRTFSFERYVRQINSCLYVCRKHNMSIKQYLRIIQFGNLLCLLRAKIHHDECAKTELYHKVDYIHNLQTQYE